jgi:hypothetical protein
MSNPSSQGFNGHIVDSEPLPLKDVFFGSYNDIRKHFYVILQNEKCVGASKPNNVSKQWLMLSVSVEG